MSKLFARIAGIFNNRIQVGVDKVGNRYFARTEEIDGISEWLRRKDGWCSKESKIRPQFRVEWICWLNGQRKKAPTPEEMAELEARRECVKLNVAFLKKEEEKSARGGSNPKATSTSKVTGPDLKSFIRQFPAALEDDKLQEASDAKDGVRTNRTESEKAKQVPESPEPTGSGESFRPGTWQPPT